MVSPSAGASWPWLPWPCAVRTDPRQKRAEASFMAGGGQAGSGRAVASVALSSHTISSCERNIHPSIDARNPRNSSLSRHLEFFWRLTSYLFVVWPQNNGNPAPSNCDSALLCRLSPPLIASSGSDGKSTFFITIHSSDVPSQSNERYASHQMASCLRSAYVNFPSLGVDRPFGRLLSPSQCKPYPSLVSTPSNLSGDNRYSLLCFFRD